MAFFPFNGQAEKFNYPGVKFAHLSSAASKFLCFAQKGLLQSRIMKIFACFNNITTSCSHLNTWVIWKMLCVRSEDQFYFFQMARLLLRQILLFCLFYHWHLIPLFIYWIPKWICLHFWTFYSIPLIKLIFMNKVSSNEHLNVLYISGCSTRLLLFNKSFQNLMA